ncbi:YtxH domain-containing protein [Neobacillus muris]|uniref:YtxH domain-containing protein n=1 Tax=Neobacillus muris TaxID=2941334 RepID=UPI00203E2786|nr:YtxH domain-containing protein [Neobacillus muris]
MSKREYETRDNNQNRTEDSSGTFLLGALIGGVVGAATALLLTTKTGKEWRDAIVGQAGLVMDKTAPLRETVKSKTTSLPIVQQSAEFINKVTSKQEETEQENEINYIPIKGTREVQNEKKITAPNNMDSVAIKKKLEEAQKAFEEEESRVKI